MGDAILIIILLWVLFIIVVVGLIRWVIRVNPRVNLLKKILAELEQINAKTPDRPAPRELSALSKSTPPANPSKPAHALEQVKIKSVPDKSSGVNCTKCQASIPSGEPMCLFAGKVVCKKCDRKLRKGAGLDDSVSTTKAVERDK